MLETSFTNRENGEAVSHWSRRVSSSAQLLVNTEEAVQDVPAVSLAELCHWRC